MMTGCHQLDSLLARSYLQESLKKKLYTPFPGQTGVLLDYDKFTLKLPNYLLTLLTNAGVYTSSVDAD